MVKSQAAAIEFGRRYRDRISGFEGTCTGKSSFISGCDQVLLTPSVDEKGAHREGHWYDDERLIDIEMEKPVERTSRKGGPEFSPPSRS